MKKGKTIATAILVALTLGTQPAGAGSSGFWETFKSILVPAVSQGTTGVVIRLIEKLGDWIAGGMSTPTYAPMPATQPQIASTMTGIGSESAWNQAPNAPGYAPAPMPSPQAPNLAGPTLSAGSIGQILPEAMIDIATKLIQVDGNGAPLRQIPPANASLKTGERFMVQFVTNLPGQVRVSNINPKGATTFLGDFYVVGGIPNHLPRLFRMQGNLGRDTFRLDFAPCQDPRRKEQMHASGVNAFYGLIQPAYVDALPLCADLGDIPISRDIGVEEISNGVQMNGVRYEANKAKLLQVEVFIEHVAN